MACHSGNKLKPDICVEDNLVENLGENIKIGEVMGIRQKKEQKNTVKRFYLYAINVKKIIQKINL